VETTKRRSILFGVIVASVIGLIYACGFPDPEVRSGNESETGADANADANDPNASDVFAIDANEVDQQVSIDGASPDALIVVDAGGPKIDATTGCDADCDCDNDGFDRPNCGSGTGEKDCDDLDPRVRPDQGFLEIPGEPPRNGDWNCKNGIEKLYPSNVSCGLLALGACNGVQGFKNDPACGKSDTYVFCKATLVLCGEGATQVRTQACK
jgi:hypothetical protein